jgi:hypothetical protein
MGTLKKKCSDCQTKDKKIKQIRILYISLSLFLLTLLIFRILDIPERYENRNYIAYYNPTTQEITIKAGQEVSLNSTIFDLVHEHAHKIWYTKLTPEDHAEWKNILNHTGRISDYCYECVNETPTINNPTFIREEYAQCYAQLWDGNFPCGLGTEYFLNRWMER